MIVMDTLGPRQKQEWKSLTDDRWIRTGCHDLWDAVFIAFRDYRDAPPNMQMQMIKEKTKIVCPSLEEWLALFYQKLMEEKTLLDENENENASFFFQLLSIRLLSRELMPYLQKYIHDNPECPLDTLKDEIEKACLLLAEYRQKKKGCDEDGLIDKIQQYLRHVYRKTLSTPYDDVRIAMSYMGHDLIIISPHEKVLFDTWTENGTDYQDVVIILAHPDGSFDSIGRQTHTKDGHQKISRLFHYDDDAVTVLRQHD